jgi:hypothetical protein
MRIETANTIRVTGRSGVTDQLRDMQKGAELPARIIDRISRREAVIEIGGKRIHAEFQKGVPAGSMITLKLDEIKNNSLFFKLVDPGGREALTRLLSDYTIADMSTAQKNISGALSRHPSGIFELNALLLGLPSRQDKKEEGVSRFLSFLLKLGLDKSAVSDLSILLSGIRVDAKAFQSLLMIIGFDRERVRKWTAGQSGSMEAMIDAIIAGIDGIEGNEMKETAVRQLISLLANAGETPADYVSGELPFFDEDESRPIHYMGKNDAWVFSVDFSAIGLIEVLARKNREGYQVSVFCRTAEALDVLKQSAEELEKNLASIHQDIHINFYNTAQALNKIVEIYSYYSLNSVFDTRV